MQTINKECSSPQLIRDSSRELKYDDDDLDGLNMQTPSNRMEDSKIHDDDEQTI